MCGKKTEKSDHQKNNNDQRKTKMSPNGPIRPETAKRIKGKRVVDVQNNKIKNKIEKQQQEILKSKAREYLNKKNMKPICYKMLAAFDQKYCKKKLNITSKHSKEKLDAQLFWEFNRLNQLYSSQEQQLQKYNQPTQLLPMGENINQHRKQFENMDQERQKQEGNIFLYCCQRMAAEMYKYMTQKALFFCKYNANQQLKEAIHNEIKSDMLVFSYFIVAGGKEQKKQWVNHYFHQHEAKNTKIQHRGGRGKGSMGNILEFLQEYDSTPLPQTIPLKFLTQKRQVQIRKMEQNSMKSRQSRNCTK